MVLHRKLAIGNLSDLELPDTDPQYDTRSERMQVNSPNTNVLMRIMIMIIGTMMRPTFRICIWKESVPGNFAPQWQRQQVISCFNVDDTIQVLL